MSFTLKGSPSPSLWLAVSVFAATAGLVASTALSSSVLSLFKNRAQAAQPSLRSQLPRTIEDWSLPGGDETFADPLWQKLHGFFKERGYILWIPFGLTYLGSPRELQPTCNGFAFAPVHRGWGEGSRIRQLSEIHCPNAMLRAARTVDGRDVVIRVIRVGSEGQNQLDVLQCMARGPYSQATPNHAIPLFELFELEDITFGIFPRVGFSLADAYDSWAENSVGDVIDMVLQCLEALAFLHSMNIAHRDAFKDNFLVQWHPESLAANQLTISRPRVFLHDFETAVRFSVDVPPHERTCTGLPLCPSFALPERYFRPVPPEVSSGNPYDPFELDVWQFGISLIDFRTRIPEIDDVLAEMIVEDPSKRISAFEALTDLARVVRSMPWERLNIAPIDVDELMLGRPSPPPSSLS